MTEDKIIIDCECGTLDHSIQFLRFDRDHPFDDQIYVSVIYNQGSLISRLRNAFWMVFNPKKVKFEVAESVWGTSQIEKLKNWLDSED